MSKKKPEPTELEQELQAQVEALTEALQRERADNANIRRRHDDQMAALKAIVKASVVRDLLPVIDNFERALGSKQMTADSKQLNDFEKGIVSILKQFQQVLEKLGVNRIKTVGELFDPRIHEAVSMEDGEGDTEVVSEELQAGYTLGDEVIRHAMVRVTMGKINTKIS